MINTITETHSVHGTLGLRPDGSWPWGGNGEASHSRLPAAASLTPSSSWLHLQGHSLLPTPTVWHLPGFAESPHPCH